MLTKRHFQETARIIAKARTLTSRDEAIIDWLANDFADYFGNENPRFDRPKFMQACGKALDTKIGE